MMERFGRTSLVGVALLLVLGGFFSIPVSVKAETWRVVDLDPSKRLHIRQNANSRSRIVGYIPGQTRGLKSDRCSGNWCRITYNGVRGWVYDKYLERDVAVATPAEPVPAETPRLGPNELAKLEVLKLTEGDGRPIPVYAFPDENLPIAGALPPETTQVEGLGTCLRDWCYVRAGRLIGWMSNKRFALEDSLKKAGKAEKTGTKVAAYSVDDVPPSDADIPDTTGALPEQDVIAEEAKALNETETTATNVAINGNATRLDEQAIPSDTTLYALAGLAGGSSLAIHESADGQSGIRGWLPHDAKNVEGLKECVEKWCRIRWKGQTGWVLRRHLADESLAGKRRFQVTGLSLWKPLEVLDHPDETAAVVGSIPSYATGIMPIGSCNKYWCHVRYLGIAGWVRANFLRPQNQP